MTINRILIESLNKLADYSDRGADKLREIEQKSKLTQCECRKCEGQLICSYLHGENELHREGLCDRCI